MKVFIVRGTTREVNNDDGWYFHRVLEKRNIPHVLAGHESLVLDNVFAKGIETIGSVVLSRPSTDFGFRYWKADRRLLHQCAQFKPDLILVMGGKTLRPQLLKALRARLPKVKLVNTFWDNPLFYENAFAGIPEYDRFYIKESYVLNELRKLGAENTAYLHQACDPEEHRSLPDITAEEKKMFGCDLSMVGSMYPYRLKMLEVLADMDLKIWGGHWGKMPSNGIAYTKHQGRRVWGREKVLVFNLSKINLNTQNFQNDIYSVSLKIHQVASCGGFQLIDYKPDIEKLYRLGSEIIAFRSREELRELALYYLDHPEERSTIAARSRQRAVAEHTYAHRLDEILHDLKLG